MPFSEPSNKKIVLASGSPRRQQFLKDLGLDFEIRVREVDEVYPDALQGPEITDYLARLKASALADTITDAEILVTSDTIVWHNGRALGKPRDYGDAFSMLQELSGSVHEVFTSVCLTSKEKQVVFHEATRVTFSPVSDAAINFYLDQYKPFDKAGSYGIQDWLGLTAISRLEGSYTNVVGLPTERFYREIAQF